MHALTVLQKHALVADPSDGANGVSDYGGALCGCCKPNSPAIDWMLSCAGALQGRQRDPTYLAAVIAPCQASGLSLGLQALLKGLSRQRLWTES